MRACSSVSRFFESASTPARLTRSVYSVIASIAAMTSRTPPIGVPTRSHRRLRSLREGARVRSTTSALDIGPSPRSRASLSPCVRLLQCYPEPCNHPCGEARSMKGYLFAEIEIIDPETYKQYMPLAAAAIAAFGGRYLVRGGDPEVLEGDRNTKRVVVLEFETIERARAFYHSAQYQAAAS